MYKVKIISNLIDYDVTTSRTVENDLKEVEEKVNKFLDEHNTIETQIKQTIAQGARRETILTLL